MIAGRGLSTRVRRPERMDDPRLDPAEHRRALRGLTRLNGISHTVGHLWEAIRRGVRDRPTVPLRILDAACGAGDIALGLSATARADGWPATVVGCDVSPVAIEHARASTTDSDVSFECRDLLRDGVPDGFDVVCCSLFLHHLSNEEARAFLADARSAARRMVVVSDLVRSRWGFVLAWCATRLMTTSPVVRFDGPVSVRAAFTPAEVGAIARTAGLDPVVLECHFPARFLLTWTRDGDDR